MELIPYAIIISMNGCIGYTIMKSSEFRQNSQNEGTQNQKKTKLEVEMAITLAAISMMFVLCQSIKLIADVYEQSVCDYFKIARGEKESKSKCNPPTHIDVATCFGNLFVCINSAANFLMYMVKGKKFRDAFCQTYFLCGPKNNERNTRSFITGQTYVK